MNIKARYKSYAHQTWSKVVRARANHLCEWCNYPATEAHHMLGTEGKVRFMLENGVSICRECHAYFHDVSKEPGIAKFKAQRPDDWALIEPLANCVEPLKFHEIKETLAGLREELRRVA